MSVDRIGPKSPRPPVDPGATGAQRPVRDKPTLSGSRAPKLSVVDGRGREAEANPVSESEAEGIRQAKIAEVRIKILNGYYARRDIQTQDRLGR